MEFDCPACKATLRVNPLLTGAMMSCPKCGTRIDVPKGGRREEARPEPPPEPPRPKPASKPAPKAAPAPKPPPAPVRPRFTVWLLGCQLVLLALGASCIWGAFMAEGEGWPEWSYLRDNPLHLTGAGVVLLVLGAAAGHAPVLWSLVAVLFVMGACGYHFYAAGTVDASRALALSVTMFALWLALQHRR